MSLQQAVKIVQNSCVTWAEVWVGSEYYDLVKMNDKWIERKPELKDGRKRRSKTDSIRPSDILKMRKKMTWEAIAKHYKVSVPTIRKILNE